MNRKPYPSDVSDDEWAFAAPYLTMITEDAPQREHLLREVFNGLRWIIRAGAPWYTVYQQTQRWLKAGVFEAMVHDLRALLCLARDYERLPETLAGLHFLAFAIVMLKQFVHLMV